MNSHQRKKRRRWYNRRGFYIINEKDLGCIYNLLFALKGLDLESRDNRTLEHALLVRSRQLRVMRGDDGIFKLAKQT